MDDSPSVCAKSVQSRKFYDAPAKTLVPRSARKEPSQGECSKLAELIRDNVIGAETSFSGPYGRRRITYCDYIASGRSLKFVEEFIGEQVLPFYGNTHTVTTVTSMQTTLFRHEARDIFRNSCGASEADAVIFAGHGCTGAVHKLIDATGLRKSTRKVVVFASGMEHHSNLLPWRDLDNSLIVNVDEDASGRLDLADLESKLHKYHSNSNAQLIGCFCAVSNVTGVLNDDLAITALLHKHGALAFWDYATAAPYVKIEMNPKVSADNANLCSKDAMFFSCHKFVGGVQTPGVLIIKKKLFANEVPNGGGGGSVFFVSPDDHRYLKDPEVREEGGTPAIVESIRAGMVMQLKESVSTEYIMRREEALITTAMKRLKDIPNLVLLGNSSLPRLPIISFLIKNHESGLFLHHNFVCALLNDLFGIQARGGCACAGPYVQNLVGIDHQMARDYEALLIEDERLDRAHLRRGQSEYSSFEILRPGFSRLNLSWFSSEAEVDFVLDALEVVARDGWKLMPQYRMNNETGDWKHFSNLEYKERKWLGNISYSSGSFAFSDALVDSCEKVMDFAETIAKAKEIVAEASKQAQKYNIPDHRILFQDESARKLRWFLLPFEVKEIMCSKKTISEKAPFIPKTNFLTCDNNSYKKSGSYHPAFEPSSDLLSILSQTSNVSIKSWLEQKPANENNVEPKVSEIKVSNRDGRAKDSNLNCTDGLCVLTEKREKLSEEALIKKPKWRPPPKEIFRPFLEAVEDFEMIQNGDRVLLCLSGGKDSLSLLHTLKQYQFYGKKNGISFDLGAVTVDPLSSAYDPRPLIPYLAALGVEYLYEEQAIMEQALKADCSSICAFCSRMKRGRIYAAARRAKYNVLAMGQHLDDLAESFLMSVFHNGRLRTMKANYAVAEGDLRVIRPFAYVREKQLRDFAEGSKLPVIPENCPACFESPKERHRTKQLLATQELLFPRLYWSMKTAMRPVMNIRKTGLENQMFGKKQAFEEDVDEADEL